MTCCSCEHTHFYSASGTNEGGHYHGDTTPKFAKYTGYFSLAQKIVSIEDAFERVEKDKENDPEKSRQRKKQKV